MLKVSFKSLNASLLVLRLIADEKNSKWYDADLSEDITQLFPEVFKVEESQQEEEEQEE